MLKLGLALSATLLAAPTFLYRVQASSYGVSTEVFPSSLPGAARQDRRRPPGVVTLNVHVLRTSDGGATGKVGLFADRYPKTVRVKNSAMFADRIAAIGAAYHVWIVPKGWSGSASVGGDGSTVVDLHSKKGSTGSGPRFHYEDTGGCAGCALSEAAPYFSRAMRGWKEFFGYETLETVPSGLKATSISPDLMAYTLPDKDGLVARGIMYYDAHDMFFENALFVLPHADKELLGFLLHTLVTREKLR